MAEAMVPDANVSAIARRNGLSPAQLFGWKRQALERLNVPQSESSLDDRKGTEVDIATDHPVIVEIIIGGITIRAGADIGEEALKRVIRAVRSA